MTPAQLLKARMLLKIHFLDFYMDFVPESLIAVSDEQGERFHQDIHWMELWYQGRWDPGMMQLSLLAGKRGWNTTWEEKVNL